MNKRLYKDEVNDPALHQAVNQEDIAAVKDMTRYKEDIDAKDEYGWTALHFAASGGHTEIADVLINAGANVFACDNTGKTPLDAALELRDEDSEIACLLREAMQKQGG